MALTSHSSPRVEVAWTTTNPLTASPAWADVIDDVDMVAGISWNRGRSDEQGTVSPGNMTLTLRNDDGEYTPARASSSLYPDVTLGKRIRLRARTGTGSANYITAESASFEGATVGSWAGNPLGFTACTVANTVTFAQFGTRALLITWPTAAANGSAAQLTAAGLVESLVIGRQYTISAYVRVPASNPAVRIGELFGVVTVTSPVGFSTTSSTTGSFERIAGTFVAEANTLRFGIVNSGAATAGQTVVVDGVQLDEGAVPVTFTTSAPPIYGRFDGVITSLDPVFDDNGGQTVVEASDITRLLGDTNLLASMLEEEVLLEDPVGYYPLSEGEGSTTAGSIAKSSVAPILTATQRGSGGTLTFGTGTGPGYDGLSAAVFAPASTTQGLYLEGTSTSRFTVGGVSGALTFECFVNTSTAAVQTIVKLVDPYGVFVTLEVSAASKLVANFSDPYALTSGTITSASNVTGGTKHVAVTISVAATTATMTLYINGVSVGTTTWTQSTGLLYGWKSLYVGGDPSGNLLTGTVSHVAVTIADVGATRLLEHYEAGMTGFAGELSGARAERILGYRLPAGLINAETGSSTIGPQATAGAGALDGVQAVADSERGVVFAAGDGRVTFHGRAHRYNSTADITADAEGDLGTSELTLSLSDQFLVNDVTVTRYQGASQRVVNEDSLEAFGTYTSSLDLIVDSDTLAGNIATNVANRNAFPTPRIAGLSFDMLTTTTAGIDDDIMAADIGTRCDVSGLRSTAPTTSLQLFVEGVGEKIDASSWETSFTTSPADTTAVWILGDSTYGVLGSTTRLAL